MLGMLNIFRGSPEYVVPTRKQAVPEWTQMDMSPINQTIENYKSEATIWNEYFSYHLSRQEHLNPTTIKDIATLADFMLEEYNDRFGGEDAS